MSETVFEQSLQLILQEPTAAVVVAVLALGLVGMSMRSIIDAVVTRDDEPLPEGESAVATSRSTGGTESGATTQSTETAPKGGSKTLSDGGRSQSRSGASTESDEELEHRLDELEHEVDALSSTVNTVQNENEQISRSVQDIEENTSRLLNLYEMATRGVNPFAGGDTDPENGAVESGPVGSVTGQKQEDSEFSKEDEIEEIETDVADDDAADLFNSDTDAAGIREEHCVDSVEEVVDAPETEDAFQQSKTETSEGESAEAVEEVAEFPENGFEFGVAGTDGNETAESDTDSFGTEEMIDASSCGDEVAASDGGMVIEPDNEPSSTGGKSTPDDGNADAAGTATSEQEPTGATQQASTATESDAAPTNQSSAASEPVVAVAAADVEEAERVESNETSVPQPATVATSEAGKPYVEDLPEGFSTEVMTVEWLEFLVDEVGIRGTVRALDYYETIGWITEDAAAELDEYLDGFEAADGGDLSVELHLRSLDYVEELQHAGEN